MVNRYIKLTNEDLTQIEEEVMMGGNDYRELVMDGTLVLAMVKEIQVLRKKIGENNG